MPSNPANCDICGAGFPSKIFRFISSTIEILSAPERTVEELTRLAQILRDAKTKQQSNEQVTSQIKRELPVLSPLADLLSKKQGELYGYLTFVLAAIQLLTQS